MKTMDIFYHDLNTEAQKEHDKLFGGPEKHNHDISPLAILEREDEDEDENDLIGLPRVETLTDEDGITLKKGTKVFADGGNISGKITALYANDTVDIHHADSHQGPVIDTFHITHNDVRIDEDDVKQPFIAVKDKHLELMQVPNVSEEDNYEPKGFKLLDTVLVDNSGFGTENEPALTIGRFLKSIIKDRAYAITGVGQFQVEIGVFEKT